MVAHALKSLNMDTIAYITSFPIPETIQQINSLLLGCRLILPECKINLMYIGTWADMEIETAAARKMFVENRLRIIGQQTDTIAPQLVSFYVYLENENGRPLVDVYVYMKIYENICYTCV